LSRVEAGVRVGASAKQSTSQGQPPHINPSVSFTLIEVQ
jgi:hypothetical protein